MMQCYSWIHHHGMRLVLISGIGGHLETEFGFIAAKELVKVGARLGSARDARKAPAIQFARKGCEFGSLEVNGQDFCENIFKKRESSHEEKN